MVFYVLSRSEELLTVLSNDGDRSATLCGATLHEVINDMYTLEFDVPAEVSEVTYLDEENYILFQDLRSEWQLYTIKQVTENHGFEHTKHIYAEHSSQELLDCLCSTELKKVTVSIKSAMTTALFGTRWTVDDNSSTDQITIRDNTKNSTVLEVLDLVRERKNYDIKFSFEVAGNQITSRKVLITKNIGRDIGKKFEYHKDIVNIERVIDTTDLKTAIIPVGNDNLSISSVTWTTPTNPLSKPSGQNYLIDPDATERWGYGTTTKKPRYMYYVNEDIETAAELLEEAWDMLNKYNQPKITYTMDAIDLYAVNNFSSTYRHESVKLGDLVVVVDKTFSPDLIIESNIVEREVDLLEPQNTKITLGTYAKNLSHIESRLERTLGKKISEPQLELATPHIINFSVDNMVIPTDYYGVTKTDITIKTKVGTYKGAKRIESIIGTLALKDSTDKAIVNSGITLSKSNPTDTASGYITFTIAQGTYLPTDYGFIEIPISIGYYDYEKQVQYSKAKDGEKGDKGDSGLQGSSGVSAYTHIAYATNSTGTSGFSTTDSTNATYIGIYTDNVALDSGNPTSYKWTLIKGAKGDQGTPGVTGADGQTPYVHFAYANNSSGTLDFSTTVALNKSYIGHYTDYVVADSTDPAKYIWTLVKGTDGTNGTNGTNGANAIMGVLSNEAHTVPADVNGTVTSLTGAATTLSIFIGNTDDSSNWTVTAGTPSGMTGTLSGKTYTVTGVSFDTAYIDLTATRSGYASIVKRFVVTKSKQGITGATGASATAYWLVNSVPAIAKSLTGVYTPTTLTVTGKNQIGTGTPTDYACRFIILETTDGSTYTVKYTSSANETTKTYTPTSGIKAVKVQMYLAGGTTALLDEQITPIVSDGATGANGTNGTNGTNGVNAIIGILSNETHTVPADASGTVTSLSGASTTMSIYNGATDDSANWTVTAGTPSGLAGSLVGKTYTVSSVSSDIAYVDLTASRSGYSSIIKRFTVTKSKQGLTGAIGSTGTAGKVAKIVATSQMFKSTDGGVTFSPDTISLTPALQVVTFSKWQYSVNGGSTWVDTVSGSNGITISSNVLTIAKTSALYTSSITSLVFKLVSSDATVYDTVTIVKLYDVVNITGVSFTDVGNSTTYDNATITVDSDDSVNSAFISSTGITFISSSALSIPVMGLHSSSDGKHLTLEPNLISMEVHDPSTTELLQSVYITPNSISVDGGLEGSSITKDGYEVLTTLDATNYRKVQSQYVTNMAATEGWYRVATVPMTSSFKNTMFKVKSYTSTGTVTESTIIVNMAYYSGSYASETPSVFANTSHSYNAQTNVENGWVLQYVRVSFDGTNGYIDLYKYKTTAVTTICEPLVESAWVFVTGSPTVNPTVGAYKNVRVTLLAGITNNNLISVSSTDGSRAIFTPTSIELGGSGCSITNNGSTGFVINDSISMSGTYGIRTSGTLNLENTTDVTLSSTNNALQIGLTTGDNVVFDNNEIQARNNGAADNIYINNNGGGVYVNNGIIYGGDSGKVTLTLQNSVTAYGTSWTPFYRKLGKLVELRGAVTGKTGMNNATGIVFGTLPVGYCPSMTVQVLCQGTSADNWLLTIGTDGSCKASRYATGSAYATSIAGTEWLPFHVVFSID